MRTGVFRDRKEAGAKLAQALLGYRGANALVLALPRGGVPIGYEIARVLACPLDTIVARKVGMPGNPEYAVGAIAPGGVRAIEEWAGNVEEVVQAETREMRRRMEIYKSGSYAGDLEPGTVIVVDDGVATGKTALAALRSVRARYPDAQLVFAAPVGAPDSLRELGKEADKVVVLEAPPGFSAVGEWYEIFPQLTDGEVIGYLSEVSK